MEASMDRYRVQWQAASGAWELPGCDASEATFETSQDAAAAIAALKADEDWQDATFRVVDLAEGHDAHRRETPPSITGTCPMCQGEASAARSAAAVLGRKGGKAGKGASKVRGDSEHYKAIRARAKRYAWEAIAQHDNRDAGFVCSGTTDARCRQLAAARTKKSVRVRRILATPEHYALIETEEQKTAGVYGLTLR
jgi:hypothetical protein